MARWQIQALLVVLVLPVVLALLVHLADLGFPVNLEALVYLVDRWVLVLLVVPV